MRGFDIVLAGVVATTMMMIVMGVIHRLGLAHADMVRAIGSLLTRSKKGAWKLGLVVHYSMGILFAFAYALLLGLAPLNSFSAVLILSTFTGMVHGVVVGLLLTVMVAEHHPVESFQRAGAGVVIAHKIGHVFYGFFVGLTLGMMGSPIARRSGTASVPWEEIFGVSTAWVLLLGAPLLILALAIVPWVRQHKPAEV